MAVPSCTAIGTIESMNERQQIRDESNRRERIERHCAARELPCFVISAATGAGLADLVRGIAAALASGELAPARLP